MTTLLLSELLDGAQAILPPAPGYTPANHPMRNVKPDDWMLKGIRAQAEAMQRVMGASINSDRERTSK